MENEISAIADSGVAARAATMRAAARGQLRSEIEQLYALARSWLEAADAGQYHAGLLAMQSALNRAARKEAELGAVERVVRP